MPGPSPPESSRRGPGRRLGGDAAWRGEDLAGSTAWVHRLSPVELGELEAAAARVSGRPIAALGRDDFPLPTFGRTLAGLRDEILGGRGFVLLRGLPVGDRPRAELAAMFWGIGAHLGSAVPQNARGDLLGHVVDVGRDAADPTARIYQTNARQGFHTDSADVVALLCLQTAQSGGRSSLVSAAAVHDAMFERHPDLLEVLFDAFHTDHRGEAPPGAPPFFVAPVLHWFADRLSVLYQRSYIESAQRFAAVPRLSDRQRAALDAFDALCEDPALHLEMDLEPGDVQLIHNHQLLHDRTAFEDAPGRRRHLLRLWLSPPVGRPLPACFAERLRSTEAGQRGGVVVPGVAPVVRLEP